MLKSILSLSFISIISVSAFAQTDSTGKPSTVKTLSLKQYDALQKGEDMYHMGWAAELNHYPAPDKVLASKDKLKLDDAQVSKITAINTELIRKKKEMGVFIIRNERAIDSLFRIKRINDGNLIYYTNRYGIYQGELRNAILQACLKTQKLLTAKQINKFERLQDNK
ncbi:hypothetical protein LJ707_16850 [Mucilaginibacter sp. UR6-1]|uniref:hypothetical protein n=1 Tax=Mucilaginibacter sp. UR6-1 TaxID=1435643 RepID=UPI001E3BA39E|nr:hypothetical protein [Mucilaginibacter sp. UR6-1]MCC8410614.1 hypothetical protein [Mucilaginibacter sp. UR6-1]